MINITPDLHVAKKFVGALQLSSRHVSQSISTVRRIYCEHQAHIVILLVIWLTFYKLRPAEDKHANLPMLLIILLLTTLLIASIKVD